MNRQVANSVEFKPEVDTSARIARISSTVERELSQLPIKLSDQLRELITNTSEINQGNASTCTQAALMYEMARKDPQELVRIVADLNRNGQCKLRDGTIVKLSQDAFKPDIIPEGMPFKARNTVERIFQDSLFEAFCVNDNGRKYISPETTKAMLASISGQQYTTIGREKDLNTIVEAIRKNPSLVASHFNGTQLVINFCAGGKDQLHAAQLVGARIAEDGSIKVQIFHGWGEGTTHGGILPRTRNNSNGVEEVSLDDLQKTLVAAHVPNNSQIIDQYRLEDTTSEMRIPATTPFNTPSEIWNDSYFEIERRNKDDKRRRDEFYEELAKRAKG